MSGIKPFALAAVACLLVACSSSSSHQANIAASDYDQSCQQDDECVAVYEGDVCACGGCDNAAINASDSTAYSADRDAAQSTCPSGQQCFDGACAQAATLCVHGSCEAYQLDSVTDVIDRSCQSDEDCALMPNSFGAKCGCQVAVSKSGRAIAARIHAQIAEMTPASCNCEDIGPPKCVDGTCQTANGDGCHVIGWDSHSCQ